MSAITRFQTVATGPQFKLARNLTAMAIADGHLTTEEKEVRARYDVFGLLLTTATDRNGCVVVAFGVSKRNEWSFQT